MSRIVVAKARRIHIDAIVELWKDFMDFHARLDDHFKRSKRGHLKFRDLITKTFGSRKWQLFVVLADKVVIGYSLVRIADPPFVLSSARYGRILDAYLEPNHRRQGTGELLFQTVKDWCLSKGITRLELNAATRNNIACSFWRKMGFKEYLKTMSLPI